MHQTSGAEVAGSNPASTTMFLNKVEKYQGRDGNLPTPEAKKKMKKKKKKNIFCKNFVGCFSFDFKFVLYSTTYCKQN